jgi:hypothetical protein
MGPRESEAEKTGQTPKTINPEALIYSFLEVEEQCIEIFRKVFSMKKDFY